MNNNIKQIEQRLKAAALAILLFISGPVVSNASSIEDGRKMDFSTSDVQYPPRYYSERVRTLVSEFNRLGNDNISNDMAYNMMGVVNFRLIFDGISEDDLERVSLETFMKIYKWGELAIQPGGEELKFSRFLENPRDHGTLLDVEKLVSDFNKARPTEEQIKDGNVKEWNNIIFAVREIDRNAYVPPVELLSLLLLNKTLGKIPSNYVTIDPVTDVVIPMEGRARNDIMKDGRENRMDFYASNESGTLFQKWSIYHDNYELEGFYKDRYREYLKENYPETYSEEAVEKGYLWYNPELTEEELKALPIPANVKQAGEFYRYGVRSDAEEILDKAVNSLLTRMRNQTKTISESSLDTFTENKLLEKSKLV